MKILTKATGIDGLKVLYLTHRLPYPPDRGDRIRAHYVLRHLAARARVGLLSLVHTPAEAAAGERLKEFVEVIQLCPVAARRYLSALTSLPTGRPLTHALLDAPGIERQLADLVSRFRPDVVLAYCSSMARLALQPALRGLPFVVDMVDVDSAKWAELAGISAYPKRWIYRREARCLEAFEIRAIRAARATLAVNEREADALRGLVPDAAIHVVANGIDLDRFRPPARDTVEHVRAVFCGVLNYEPNEEAALRLGSTIWPLVRASLPEARLTLVGAAPTRAVRNLADRDRSIQVTGQVDDVRPYLWQGSVSVAPLRVARGLQNKVLEALAAELPVVLTPAVLEGLPQTARRGCVVAESDESLADQIVRLLRLPTSERRSIASQANLAELSWESQLQPLAGILDRASTRPVP